MAKKDTTPMKGAGTQFFRLKDDKETTAIQGGTISAAEIKKADNWERIAKIKELSPGEVTAESYEDNYLDDPNAGSQQVKVLNQRVKHQSLLHGYQAILRNKLSSQTLIAVRRNFTLLYIQTVHEMYILLGFHL